MKRHYRHLPLTFCAALCAAPAATFAAGGVLEINQLCAVGDVAQNTGCFPGDSPGFPVTISRELLGPANDRNTRSHNFRLTSDLIPNNSAIRVEIDDVTVDLNGFVIGGPSVSGTGSGVTIVGDDDREGITVRNGVIRNMSRYGVELGKYSRVENLTIIECDRDGINVDEGSVVSNNIVHESRNDGISVGAGSTVSHNTVFDSGDNGIRAGLGAAVTANTVRGSAEFGLLLETNSGYRSNVLSDNNGGDEAAQVSGGIDLGGNLCGADGSCP